MATKTKPAPVQDAVLNTLFDNGPSTRQDINAFNQTLNQMESAGLIVKRGVQKHGDEDKPGRGRPLTVWALTKKSRDRIKRQRAKAQTA